MLSILNNQIKCSYSICINFGNLEDYADSILSHMTLLEGLGNKITALQLDCRIKTGVLNVARGYFLDHILANCFQLEHLVLIDAFLSHCSPILPIKKSKLCSSAYM
jgi:hypothetical protein